MPVRQGEFPYTTLFRSMAEREKWEVVQAHLQAKEEAHVQAEEEAHAAAEKAWREEEEHVWEQVHLAAEARAREEEQHVCKEEERLAVERDLHEVEGPSQERAPWRQLFLLLSDSAGSLKEEEKVESPPRDKGKG